jgi:phosphoribosylamine--glycine ligase
MSGLDEVAGSSLYHAGTKLSDAGEIVSNGGRVMAITSLGSSIQVALNQSLENAEKIQYENKYYRKDIGFEFL